MSSNPRSLVAVRCAVCDKEILRKPSKVENSKSGIFFCSREHMSAGAKRDSKIGYHTGPKPTAVEASKILNNCKYCNRGFHPTRKQKKFCSPDCKAKYLSEVTHENCLKCGKQKSVSEFYRQGTGYSIFCKDCASESWKAWYATDKATKQASNATRNQEWSRTENAAVTLFRKRLDRYGLTDQQYRNLYDKYEGKCHSCQRHAATDIDHDHNSGHVRGLLCSRCNMGIGLLGDDIEGITAALRYLSRS